MRKNMTNKEEAEWLKEWWKNYGQGILLAVIIGLCIGFGWRYWNTQRQQKAYAASELYQQTQAVLSTSNSNVETAIKALKKTHPNSIYTQLASLAAAKTAVQNKKYAEAITGLKTIMAKPQLPMLGQIARIRIAEVQMQMGQPQQALTTLSTVTDKSFQPMIDNEKAAAYIQLKQLDQAKNYLQKAIDGYNQLHIDTTLLRLNEGLK